MQPSLRSRAKNVVNYLQRMASSKGYLVAKTVRTGKKQLIVLPPAVNENATNADDQRIIRAEEVKMVAKRRLKLEDVLKKGYAMVYDQYSQEVKDKLEVTNDWECIQQDQSLHELIQKVEQICVGFDDHKQEVFNMVQALKTLFLYTQGEKDGVDQYGRNFRSLWDTVEAFGGLPGVHKGLVEVLVKNPSQVNDINNVTLKERREAEETACKAVKAALLISGMDKWQYGKLKDKLANNYLLGTDQYPDAFNKALCILGNYQTSKSSTPFRASPDNTGVAFLQRGGRGGQGGCGRRGRETGRGEGNGGGADAGEGRSGSNGMSTVTGGSGGEAAARTNSRGKSHCFNCGATDHWAYECPQLSNEQQAQLHMNLEEQGETKDQEEEGHQLLNVTLAQGGNLPENQAYLDGCSTVTAFKTDKYLKGIKTLPSGIKINCNAGVVLTNRMGTYGKLKVWYLPGGIANIFLMHKLEKLYRITYDSLEGHYIVHTPQGAVKFYKNEQGLPYINLEASTKAVVMLLQSAQPEETTRIKTATTLVQTVQKNYEGYTKREVLKAKEVHQGQAMIGNPSKGDYRGLVSSNMISNCPIAPTDITNARAIFGPDLASVRGKNSPSDSRAGGDRSCGSTLRGGGKEQSSDNGG